MADGPAETGGRTIDVLRRQLAVAKAERDEAQAREAALAEILRVISQSPTDVQPVLKVVVKAAQRFCGANDVVIGLRDGEELLIAAHEGPLPRPALRRKLDRTSSQGRALIDGRTVHNPDMSALDPVEWAQGIELARVNGFRAALAVPMLRDGKGIGTIMLRRPDPGPFAPRQIALAEAFAVQAVIALENTRLFTELRESLEQQTATGEVLKVISESPTDVQPVLRVVAAAARRFCGAGDALIALRDDNDMHIATHDGPLWAPVGETSPIDRRRVTGRAILEARTIHLPETNDLDPLEYSSTIALARSQNVRAHLVAPMLREGAAIGSILLRKSEPGPFAPRQIALLESFAAQGVIAIENVRLFTELRESLEQQTASAEILQVISESPTDVQPVLEAVAKAALRFCGAEDVGIFLREGEQYLMAAHEGPMVPEVGVRYPLSRQTAPGQAMLDSWTAHFPDIGALDSVEYAAAREFSLRHGFKAAIAAPMLREGTAIGAVTLRRSQAGAFTSRQIELLESFAAQAVIALENTRLFTELQKRTDDLTESLEYQTATGELLEVISRSTTDIQPVFDTMLASAARLCGVQKGDIAVRQGNAFGYAASIGPTQQELAWLKERILVPGRTTTAGRALQERQVVQTLDQSLDRELEHPDAVKAARTVIAIPLLHDGEPVGIVTLLRDRVEAFSDRQVALLRTFADQAVIAMENARLLGELRQRTDDLTESLDYQTATSEVLGVISRSPASLRPVLEAMTAAAVRLCGVKTGGLSVRRGESLQFVALVGQTPEFERWQSSTPIPVRRGVPLGDAILDKEPVQIVDVMETEAYKAGADVERAVVDLGGHRTILHVPLLRDDEAIGVLTVSRGEPQAFSERQIGLIETFADQAVIAMENARLLGELRQRTDDLQESLEYQTAIGEVLEVIGRSTSDIQPVLDTMLSAALRLCMTESGGISVQQGEVFRYVATLGWGPDADETSRNQHITPGRGTIAARVLAEGQIVQVEDLATDPEYALPDMAERADWHTALGVPLLRDDRPIGVIAITRHRIEPFTERQIALVKTFADQAVIAMENARLLGELRESLEYQTATSEVLEVISRSASDVQPVLESMLSAAVRLCGVQMGGVAVRRGDVLRYVATMGVTAAFDRFLRETPHPLDRGSAAGRAALGKGVAHIPDVAGDPDYAMPTTTTIGNMRALLAVPLMREEEVVGTITLGRENAGSFTERQIALVKTFADQAVIAMENARLLSELRDRQAELRVTFDNMGDGVVMFDADLRLAAWNRNFQELLDVPDDFLASRPGLEDYVRLLVARGELGDRDPDKEVARYRDRATRQWSAERTRPDGRVLEVRNNPVPGGGAVLIYSDITKRKQAEADIRSARDAAEAALERQTATADILKVIASSPSDTKPAFDAIAESANRLLGGLTTAVWRMEGEAATLAAYTSISPDADAALRALSPLRLVDFPSLAPVMLEGKVAQMAEVEEMAPAAREVARKRGYRSQLLVPLLAQGAPIGFFSVTRASAGGFSEEDVQLLQTFADQAAIAIENARLFNDLRDSLQRLRAAQANLIQSEKMASLGQLTAGIAHEIKNPLNFVNNFATLSVELLDELKESAGDALAKLDKDKRAEVDETMELLTGNLGKIAEHGKRADGIVRSMLSHSRGGSGDWAPSDINMLVEEALNLAFHGARAQDKEFNVTLERDFEKAGKPIEVVPQDITRVFLNLFGNGFYAAGKRRVNVNETGFKPTVRVSTRDLGEAVEVRVRDNGIGIPPEVREKLFQPFFTTKPTGEGTGLGLSISYDIVTQQHGGTIEVDSEPDNFTEFTVRLPRSRRVIVNNGD